MKTELYLIVVFALVTLLAAIGLAGCSSEANGYQEPVKPESSSGGQGGAPSVPSEGGAGGELAKPPSCAVTLDNCKEAWSELQAWTLEPDAFYRFRADQFLVLVIGSQGYEHPEGTHNQIITIVNDTGEPVTLLTTSEQSELSAWNNPWRGDLTNLTKWPVAETIGGEPFRYLDESEVYLWAKTPLEPYQGGAGGESGAN